MKRAMFLYFMFGWAFVLSALSLVMGSTEVLLMFLLFVGVLFVATMVPKKKPPSRAASIEEYRARRIQRMSSNSVHGKPSPSGHVNVHR